MTDPKPDSEMLSNESEMLETQVEEEEPFDRERAMETIRKLRESEKVMKKTQAELDRYKAEEEKRKQAEMSETERLKAELDRVQSELTAKTVRTMQIEVAAKLGLPAALSDRLKGETLEEMEEDAKAILEALPKQKAAPNLGATNPGDKGKAEETWEQKKARLEGAPGNIWHGGGVNWGPEETS